jgi:hypothetical protein
MNALLLVILINYLIGLLFNLLIILIISLFYKLQTFLLFFLFTFLYTRDIYPDGISLLLKVNTTVDERLSRERHGGQQLTQDGEQQACHEVVAARARLKRIVVTKTIGRPSMKRHRSRQWRCRPRGPRTMPAMVQRARWETSQRPLFVKTVWRNGLRHAILSKDDPLCTRREQRRDTSNPTILTRLIPSQSSQVITPARPSELERCLMKLQLVLATEPRPNNVVLVSSPPREQRRVEFVRQLPCEINRVEPPPRCGTPCSDSSDSSVNDEDEESNEDTLSPHEDEGVDENQPQVSPKGQQTCDTCDESRDMTKNWLPELNCLSERVLQWLERESKRNRPIRFDLSALRRRESTQSNPIPISSNSGPMPRVTVARRARRRVAARWSAQPKIPPPQTLTVTAHSVTRKPIVKSAPPPPPPLPSPCVTWSGEPGRPQLHIFIPTTEYELSDCCSESRFSER